MPAGEVHPGVPRSVFSVQGRVWAVGGVEAVCEAADALLPQQPHEKLQADEGEHAETEDGQDHHVGQLLHRLDQSADNGLQTLTDAGRFG